MDMYIHEYTYTYVYVYIKRHAMSDGSNRQHRMQPDQNSYLVHVVSLSPAERRGVVGLCPESQTSARIVPKVSNVSKSCKPLPRVSKVNALVL